MSRTSKNPLATFKKANKEARQRMAEKAGKTVEEYRKFLESTVAAPGVVETKTTGTILDSEGTALDMVIAFDTTGSMNAYIGDVKKHVEKVINEMFDKTADLRIKIVAFGDYCDMRGVGVFGDAYQEIELTNDRQALINFVKGAKSTGGGDGDEFYELVIQKVVNETAWRDGAARSFLLIGDADPHAIGYTYNRYVVNNQIDWKQEAKSAADKGITIDTLSIHGNSFYKEVSRITNGINIPFRKSENVSQVVSGLSYARSGSKAAFTASLNAATASGDSELIGAYKSMSTLL